MPLLKSKSKAAFGKNIETEMKAGKPQNQSIAIAYAMKKKPKKMAKGGLIESAKEEKRPDPSDTHADSQNVAQNSGKKPLKDAGWTDNTWEKFGKSMSMRQGQRPGPLPIAGHKVNDRDLFEKEQDLMALTPGPYGEALPEPMAEGGQVDETSPHTGETKEDMMRRHAMEMSSSGFDAQPGPAPEEYDADHFAHGGMFEQMKAKRMADGGEVDLEANSEESPNNEDQMSFEANGKEQYDLDQLDEQPLDSNETGDAREEDEENDHDDSIVGQIKRKAKKK